MKTETKNRIWADVLTQLNNGHAAGKNFRLQFDRENKPFVEVFNGSHWRLPNHIVEQLTGLAKKLIEAEKQKAIKRSQATAAHLKKEREELDKRLDEDGFTLLAGEATDVVCQGTLRQCRDNLWKVQRLPRDYHCGIGCWIIVDKNNIEVQEGKFDKDMCW